VDLLEKMTTFTRVVEAGSLAAAARQLRVSSAAVSRQLAALEAELGAPLVLRTTRRLSVTDLGRQYYERCLRILRDVDDARALGQRHKKALGLLSVSAGVTFGLARIVPFLPPLLAKHRELRIDLRLEDRLVDLVSDGVDIAIRAGVPASNSDSLVAHVLDAYERVVVASPAYLRGAGEPRRPEALAKHDLLLHLPASGVLGTWRFRREGQEVEVSTTSSFRSNALYALRDAAMGGAGIAMLPSWLVADEIARGELCPLLAEWRAPKVTITAIHRAEHRGAPRVRTFIEHLREAYAGVARRTRQKLA
jgi:DNA-binding transcriptional LysR family regulator